MEIEQTSNSESFAQRFSAYFQREVAQRAAKSISNGAEMEFRVQGSDPSKAQIFTFTKSGGTNRVLSGAARDPQLVFVMTPGAAESILSHPSEDIGSIGVHIAKLIVSSDPELKVSVQLKAGFLGLFSKGYFGVMTAGGSAFTSFLASRGLGGMDAIKAAFKKLRG
jgi:hypothetical protein